MIAATEVDSKSFEQSEVLVMCENGTSGAVQYGLFRSSWLQRCKTFIVFQPGDVVTLNPAFDDENFDHLISGKCLGNVSDLSCGIVVSVGPIRNGMQRNVEVVSCDATAPAVVFMSETIDSLGGVNGDGLWDGNWESLCGGDDNSVRSLYPSAILHKAHRPLVLRPGDMDRLAECLTNFLPLHDINVDVRFLIKKFGYKVTSVALYTLVIMFLSCRQIWSRILAISSPIVTINAYRNWKSKCNDVVVPSELKSMLCGSEGRPLWSVSVEDAKEGKPPSVEASSQHSPPPLSWPCGICAHKNGASKSRCAVCQTKGTPWICCMCHTRNKVNSFACSKCSIAKHAGPVDIGKVEEIPTPLPHQNITNAATSSRCILNAKTDIKVSSRPEDADKLISIFKPWESRGYLPHWIEIIIPGDFQFMYDMTIEVQDYHNYSPKDVKISCISLEDYIILSRGQLCSPSCTDDHPAQNCQVCNKSWESHLDHLCDNGARGQFFVGGRNGSHSPLLETIRRTNPTKVRILNQLSLGKTKSTVTLVSADQALGYQPKVIFIEILTLHDFGGDCKIGGLKINKTTGMEISWICPGCHCVAGPKRYVCRLCDANRPQTREASVKSDSMISLSVEKKSIARMVTNILVNCCWARRDQEMDRNYFQKWTVRCAVSQSHIMWMSSEGKVFFSLYLDDSEIVFNSGLFQTSGEKRVPIPQFPFECTVQIFPYGFYISGSDLKYLYAIPGFDGSIAESPDSYSTALDYQCVGEIQCSKVYKPVHVSDASSDDSDEDDERVDAEYMRREVAKCLVLNSELSMLQDEYILADIPLPKLEVQSSVMFWKQGHFDCIESLSQLCQWKDKDGSSAAHHAAFCGLWKSLKSLWSSGVSKWALNRRGESSMGLSCGVRGAARNFILFKFCFKRQLLDADSIFTVGVCPPMTAAALRCSEFFDTPAPMIDLITDMRNQRAEEVLERISELQEEADWSPSLTLYKALAMLQAGYGEKACAYELGHYKENLVALKSDGVLDPLYFYVVYCMWKNSYGKASASKVSRYVTELIYLS